MMKGICQKASFSFQIPSNFIASSIYTKSFRTVFSLFRIQQQIFGHGRNLPVVTQYIVLVCYALLVFPYKMFTLRLKVHLFIVLFEVLSQEKEHLDMRYIPLYMSNKYPNIFRRPFYRHRNILTAFQERELSQNIISFFSLISLKRHLYIVMKRQD